MRTRTSSVVIVTALILCGCSADVGAPLDNAATRPTALRFGMYVTPDSNPIQPAERFVGYHAGLDYEIFPEEANIDVPVYAICSGTLVFSGFAEGYGGLIAEECSINDEAVVVLYGHLDEELPENGSTVTIGQKIARLAPANSTWSDGNRKHLHLSIHKGPQLSTYGYVQSPAGLNAYLDPAKVLPPWFTGKQVDVFVVEQGAE